MTTSAALMEACQQFVVPTYSRFPLALSHGQGNRVWDFEGREYLDFGSGIAVNTLGHAHPHLLQAIQNQAAKLIHTCNLYYTEPQISLAQKLAHWMGDGKSFFCNSGAEANETLFKLARKWGHDSGRYEILTTLNSFHGRTLAGIAATGQEKVKKGFEPIMEGFRHVAFNDLEAMKQAISPKTVAILIEGIQGEIGVFPATQSYLKGLRQLCNERKLLLMMDSVQCGMFRTGRFQSYQRILEDDSTFLPDAVSMAKGIAGGLSMGSVWIHPTHADVLAAGSHGSTFGGTPLACAAALAVFDVVEKEKLADQARSLGDYLKTQLLKLNSPHILEVRGLGLMIGVELRPNIPSLTIEGKTAASLFVSRLHEQGLLTIPSGNFTIRLLPSLITTRAECDEALEKLQKTLKTL